MHYVYKIIRNKVKVCVGCLYADNNDYDDDESNSNNACGSNILLIAMTMARNDDSIIEC